MPDRVALITGAGSGIGRATAIRLSRDGYGVACSDRDHQSARATAAMLEDGVGIGCDVTVEAEVIAAIEQTVQHYGRLDVLCNNAGIGSLHRVEEETLEHFEAVMSVCARGTFLCSKYAMPHLRASRGCIVNTSSIAALVGLPNRAAYCSAKAAVLGLTRAMAVDHVGDGIRVNAVCPGTVDSPWVGRLLEAAEDPARMRDQLVARQPMGRLGTPEEIAEAIAYLASPGAAFVTGTGLVIDGGLTMQ